MDGWEVLSSSDITQRQGTKTRKAIDTEDKDWKEIITGTAIVALLFCFLQMRWYNYNDDVHVETQSHVPPNINSHRSDGTDDKVINNNNNNSNGSSPGRWDEMPWSLSVPYPRVVIMRHATRVIPESGMGLGKSARRSVGLKFEFQMAETMKLFTISARSLLPHHPSTHPPFHSFSVSL